MTVETWQHVEPDYGHTIELEGVDLATAREMVSAALKAEGFGILTEIDVQATLKQKIDKNVAPYRILGACNPQLASKALAIDPGVGLLLPCNVCVWQDDRGTTVSFVRPESMFQVATNPKLAPIAEDAAGRIRRAAAKLVELARTAK